MIESQTVQVARLLGWERGDGITWHSVRSHQAPRFRERPYDADDLLAWLTLHGYDWKITPWSLSKWLVHSAWLEVRSSDGKGLWDSSEWPHDEGPSLIQALEAAVIAAAEDE